MSPGYRAVLSQGPAYCEPDQVADTTRYLFEEPRFYDRYVAEQDTALAERFGPERLLQLVGEHVRLPRRTIRAGSAPRRTISFYPTNGVGLGHVTRLLAIARRLPPSFELIFLTPCHALAVIEHAGYRTEYVPEASHDETVPADHHAAMAPRLLAMLRYYDPGAIVFDGNVPRDSLLTACAELDTPMAWVRRGMWRADPGLARHLALSRRFDAVLEPSEAAAAADRGVTAAAPDGPLAVPPVMLLDRAELLPAADARAALGLNPNWPAALVQLGAGNNNDIDRVLDHLVAAQRRLDLQLVVAEWLIREAPVRRRGLRYLLAYPNARHLRAFDLAISAAGYNSFHELLHHDVPTIFVPNDHQKVDDQRARAEWAESRGAAICLPQGAQPAIAGYLSALLDPALRRQLARRARAVCPVNGAAGAAAAEIALAGRS
jgi:UDP:flavonoid glycosyltransferase YjiC (YdhE family)